MSSWQYIESKHIWGLRRVSELYIVKMRPDLFLTSVAPSLGPPICLKSPFFSFSSAKLPSLVYNFANHYKYWISQLPLSQLVFRHLPIKVSSLEFLTHSNVHKEESEARCTKLKKKICENTTHGMKIRMHLQS